MFTQFRAPQPAEVQLACHFLRNMTISESTVLPLGLLLNFLISETICCQAASPELSCGSVMPVMVESLKSSPANKLLIA